MPKIKTSRVNYPDGWELMEPTLLDLDAKMRQGLSLALSSPSDMYSFQFSTFNLYVGILFYLKK